jgi:hypothetical protein
MREVHAIIRPEVQRFAAAEADHKQQMLPGRVLGRVGRLWNLLAR